MAAPVGLLTNEQLYALETTFDRIYHLQGKIRPRSHFAPPLTKEQEEEAKKKPRLPPYEVAYRKPTPGEYEAFRAAANNAARVAKAQEILARATVIAVVVLGVQTIHDGQRGSAQEKAVREAFDKLLIDYPAIPEASAAGIGELAGLEKEEQEK